MDKAFLEHSLHQARDHVTRGERSIARQKAVIRELGRDGHDTWRAEQILATFEITQKLHIEDRDRLVREIAGLR